MKNTYLNGLRTQFQSLSTCDTKKKYIINKPKKRRKIRRKKTSKDSPYIPVDCVERKNLTIYLKMLIKERIERVRIEIIV